MTDDLPEEPEDQPELDPVNPDASDSNQIRKRVRKKKRESDEAREFWAGIFSTEIGRREMWKLLAAAHPFEVEFACGPNGAPQTEATWLKLGEQLFGQRVYQTWHVQHPAAVMRMLVENDPRFQQPRTS